MIEFKTRKMGAELISLKVNGLERLHDGKKYWDRQSPILFPIVGRLKNNETIIGDKKYKIFQHGFAKDMDFELVYKKDGKEIYELESNLETLKKYPYKFLLRVEYETIANKLIVRIKVINKDNKKIFFGLGAHPGFKLDMPYENYYFELEKEEENVEFMEVDGNYISNRPAKNILKNNKIIEIEKNSFSNDAIMMKNLKSNIITLKSKKNNKKIFEFNFKGFKVLALWSVVDAPFICIEPWFSYADKVIEKTHLKDKDDIISLNINEEFNCEYSVSFF